MSRLASFDTPVLGELSISLLGNKSMVAKFKLVSTENGKSYGSTTHASWSDETWKKFEELKELLEREVDDLLFVENSSPAKPATGLGELFSDDVPSV